MKIKKLDGAALQMVIIIALIITVICGSLLLLTYYKNSRYLKFSRQEHLSLNLKNAITLSLSKFQKNQDTLLTDGVFQSDSAHLKQQKWGLFDVVAIQTFHGKDSLSKAFLVGSTLKNIDEVLYVVDEDRPLSIAGDSKIIGNAYLPKAGIKSAYVEGKYYEKDKPLIFGKKLESNRGLPQIDLEAFRDIYNDFEKSKEGNNLIKKNSFFNDAVVAHQNVIKLQESLSGKFIFLADSLIEVGENANLENVILYAPVIKFLNGNKSNVQVFARDSVILGENVELNYPSAICMYREKAKKDEFSKIFIGKNSSFEGIIIARGDDDNYLKYILKLDKNCQLKGLVDIDGTFNYPTPASYQTSIHAKRMVCLLKGLLYENYLIDLKLNIHDRPSSFLGASVTDKGREKKVLKWLN
jgi:hypothetical protein